MSDQAIVIGIETYPGMSNLGGPCNDAEAFRDWLVDANGGSLDPLDVKTCLSRDFPLPNNVTDAHPVASELQALFRPLVLKAAQSQHTEGRLFIFVAGHGFADPQDMSSAALFAADAEFLIPVHLAVIDYANFFQRTWAFDQVILIMDACRTTTPLHHISRPPLPQVNPHANANKVKKFVGYGTGFNEVARERPINGGAVRGIFTMALLDALEHANPNNAGRVNGTAVKSHIHNTIDDFAGDVAITPPEIEADKRKDVLFVERAASLPDVVFQVDTAHLGSDLVIDFGGVNEVHRAAVAATPVVVPLSPGLYKARIEHTAVTVTFEVPTDGDVTL